MAISGSATSAYRVRLLDEVLVTVPTTTLGTLCTKPGADAISQLRAGNTITVAGSDMAELRRLYNEGGE